jgi:hypothetical protein
MKSEGVGALSSLRIVGVEEDEEDEDMGVTEEVFIVDSVLTGGFMREALALEDEEDEDVVSFDKKANTLVAPPAPAPLGVEVNGASNERENSLATSERIDLSPASISVSLFFLDPENL